MRAVQEAPSGDTPMGFTVLRVPFFLEPDYPEGAEFGLAFRHGNLSQYYFSIAFAERCERKMGKRWHAIAKRQPYIKFATSWCFWPRRRSCSAMPRSARCRCAGMPGARRVSPSCRG